MLGAFAAKHNSPRTLARVGKFYRPTRTIKQRWAICPPYNLFFVLPSPVRRLDQPKGSGGLGEHCSSPAVGRGVCAPPGRVAQPRLLAADRGYPAGAANRGRLFFGYFILAKQKKVACCRATRGDVDFDFDSDVRNAHPSIPQCERPYNAHPCTPPNISKNPASKFCTS